jgi:hypothetical protein
LTLPVHLSFPLTAESRSKDRAIARDRTALVAPRLLNRCHLSPNSTEKLSHHKEEFMPDIRPITAARAAIVPTFSKQFILRFALSLLLTSADADVILTFAPSVFSALLNAPILRAAFAILIIGLIASLARMWFLTFRDRP